MKSKSPSKVTPCYLNEDKLKIIIRMRPILNDQDQSQFVELQDHNTLQIKRPGNHTFMKFSNILAPDSTQKDVFYLVEDSIRQFLSGINITIFAYGQTGAGKTYSMIGNYSPKDSQQNLFNFLSSKDRGILSRSIQTIMASINKKPHLRVFVSFFQIYNDKIFDLYNNTMVPLEIRESKTGQISIPDLMNIEIETIEDAIQYLMVGLKNRATGSTHGNAQSSRSHSIFQINLQRITETGQNVYSSLRIVDLAGSQKFKIQSDLSAAEKQIRIQELTSINGSLSCLGHCISALIEKTRTHIPFRNSKLTRILSDSLIGQGKMRFIICISPSCSASAQTFSTLQFANRAKKAIFQRAQLRTPNLSKKKSSQNQEIVSLRRQLQKQKQMRVALQKQLTKRQPDREQAIMKQNVYLRKQNEKLRQQVKQLMVKKDSSRTKSPQSSRLANDVFRHYNEQIKQVEATDLKQQMLKLPIFQNIKQNSAFERGQKGQKQNNSKKSQKESSVSKKNISMNKRKAEFQRKIKRFIETDSPPENTIEKPEVSFNHKIHHEFEHPTRNEYAPVYNNGPSTSISHNKNVPVPYFYNDERESDEDEVEDGEQWMDEGDTQEFIEKTCEQMNLPQFKNFKSQVERARNELLQLKKRDQQITNKRQLKL